MLKSNVEVDYVSLGEVQVKNIQEPVRAYRVVTELGGAAPPAMISKPRRPHRMIAAVAAVVLLAGIGGGAWWAAELGRGGTSGLLSPNILERPSGPSIAVMPFASIGDAKEAGWIAQGLATDISQELTQNTTMRVVGRASILRYEGAQTNALTAGTEMKVDFVLTGTVRGSGDRLRITTELTSTSDGGQIWAGAFNSELKTKEIFALRPISGERVV